MSVRTSRLFLVSLFIIALSALLNLQQQKAGAQPSQSSEVPPPPIERADRFGVYNWNVNDSAFTDDGSSDRLNWAANKVAETGSRTIRVFIGARDDYRVNPPGGPNLAQLAQSPAYDKLFRDPRFQTYILTAYSAGAGGSDWYDGFTAYEYARERDEIKRLGEYLLDNPAFANKTFIVLNWEGDAAISSNKSVVWDYYVNWIRARAEGVKLAKRLHPTSNAHFYSGLEYTRVRRNGKPCGSPVDNPVREDPLKYRCVIDYVAPQVDVDYYSYSSWQTIVENRAISLKQRYKTDLNYALSKIKAFRPEIAERNFIIGEYGYERAQNGECVAANLLNETFDAFDGDDAFRPSYVIFWQIIDNGRLYGILNEGFGLFRIRNGRLTATLLSETFQKRIAGEQGPSYAGCPRIRQWPELPGVVNQHGTTEFILNPDSLISIHAPGDGLQLNSSFSDSGNTVNFNQLARRFELQRDNTAFWNESPTRVDFSIPSARRSGLALVYVTDARGIDSNGEQIMLSCPDCPRFNECGLTNAQDQTPHFEPGSVASITGSRFSQSGNSVVIGELRPGQVTNNRVLPRENILFESPTHIEVKLPEDLEPSYQTLIQVVNQQGLESSEYLIGVSSPCKDCAPRWRACQPIFSEAGVEFLAGAITTLAGRFQAKGNKVIVEQYDQQSRLYQHTLTEGAPGWSESDLRIRFALPTTLFPGRALVYLIDGLGRESGAHEITISPTPVTNVPSTHFRGTTLAADSIVAAFGAAMATIVQSAQSIPLPTEMAGTRVMVKDSAGVERPAPLFFISPSQINYLIPPETKNGEALVTVFNGYGSSSSGKVQIVNVSPGLFSANASGQGFAAAVVYRLKPDGTWRYEPVAEFNRELNQFVGVPIDLGTPGDQVFLILFGSGLRGYSLSSAVTATVGGTSAPVTYAGRQGMDGVDQVNLHLPTSLAGRREVDVKINVEGLSANTVRISVK
ncbi:MAG TPA: hypothetical protein VJ810_32620 [Blastocatellia bacterium]|nr:hypothetical protein [Blastocatellia bacterium]